MNIQERTSILNTVSFPYSRVFQQPDRCNILILLHIQCFQRFQRKVTPLAPKTHLLSHLCNNCVTCNIKKQLFVDLRTGQLGGGRGVILPSSTQHLNVEPRIPPASQCETFKVSRRGRRGGGEGLSRNISVWNTTAKMSHCPPFLFCIQILGPLQSYCSVELPLLAFPAVIFCVSVNTL